MQRNQPRPGQPGYQPPVWLLLVIALALAALPSTIEAVRKGLANRPAVNSPAKGYWPNRDRVRPGMTLQEVLDVCGDPEKTQYSQMGGPGTGLPSSLTAFLYYDGGKTQLHLENGRLVSISRY
jgi:hypothetical protein